MRNFVVHFMSTIYYSSFLFSFSVRLFPTDKETFNRTGESHIVFKDWFSTLYATVVLQSYSKISVYLSQNILQLYG